MPHLVFCMCAIGTYGSLHANATKRDAEARTRTEVKIREKKKKKLKKSFQLFRTFQYQMF